jgi:hypothetical protein
MPSLKTGYSRGECSSISEVSCFAGFIGDLFPCALVAIFKTIGMPERDLLVKVLMCVNRFGRTPCSTTCDLRFHRVEKEVGRALVARRSHVFTFLRRGRLISGSCGRERELPMGGLCNHAIWVRQSVWKLTRLDQFPSNRAAKSRRLFEPKSNVVSGGVDANLEVEFVPHHLDREGQVRVIGDYNRLREVSIKGVTEKHGREIYVRSLFFKFLNAYKLRWMIRRVPWASYKRPSNFVSLELPFVDRN